MKNKAERSSTSNSNCNIKKLLTYAFILICPIVFAQKISLLPDSLSFCTGDSASVEIRQQLENNAIISWITPQGIITNTKKVNAFREGRYMVKVTSQQSRTVMTDSTYVSFHSRPKKTLRDTVICKGKSVTIDARQSGLRYLWNTGETTQRISVENPGRYWAKLIDGPCTTVDTLQVRLIPGSGTALNTDYLFCLNEEHKILSVRVNPGTKILWNTGAVTPTVQATKEGTYWVRTESAICGAQVDSVHVKLKVCECEMIIPNSFTPNEDNRNDYFFPVLQCEYSYFNLNITDRWGNTVYNSNNPSAKWDGRYKGNLCPEDIYIYRIESTERSSKKEQVRNGTISLFR